MIGEEESIDWHRLTQVREEHSENKFLTKEAMK